MGIIVYTVKDAEFAHVLQPVVDLGADSEPALKPPQLFASSFMNPQVRRLRLQAFSKAAGAPVECARLNVAVLKRSYVQDPKSGFCPVPDCGKVALLPDAALREAAAVLHTIHHGGPD